MSTRANIIIKDQYDTLWFYKHSDGYPEGVMPTLKRFLSYVKTGRIRDNAQQAAGWLIAMGREEYQGSKTVAQQLDPKNNSGMDWKVGAYEPTTGQHGDIEWLYTIDLETKTIEKQAVR